MSRLRIDSEMAHRDIFLLKQVQLGKEAVKMANEAKKTQMDLKDGGADNMEIIQKRKRETWRTSKMIWRAIHIQLRWPTKPRWQIILTKTWTTEAIRWMIRAQLRWPTKWTWRIILAKIRNNLMNNPRIITMETQINQWQTILVKKQKKSETTERAIQGQRTKKQTWRTICKYI